jgi:hypothetical protein
MKDGVRSQLMRCGGRSLWFALPHDADHSQAEHPHQSAGNVSLMPAAHRFKRHGATRGWPRLGGLHHACELAGQVA